MVKFYNPKQDTSQAVNQYLSSGGVIQKLPTTKTERQLMKVTPIKRKLIR